VWLSLELNARSGSEIFDRLFRHRSIGCLLESPTTTTIKSELTRYSLCAGLPHIIDGIPQIFTPVLGEIIPCLRHLLAAPPAIDPPPVDLPFTGGWLGWLGYELAWEIETLPPLAPDPLPFPPAYWYAPAEFAVLDHWEDKLCIYAPTAAALDELAARLDTPPTIDRSIVNPNSSSPLKFYTSEAEYIESVNRVKAYVQAGDIFQANLSLRFSKRTTIDRWEIYQRLQRINPSPFASYWQTPWGEMVSCSPERLVKIVNNIVETRPIAGTRPRGSTAEIDRQLAEELRHHPKEIAEHIMLVDLERNDLGRVCTWGTVKVDELLTIEHYSHVMHLVSNVVGELAVDCDAIDTIAAVFPGGTITGCPKVRCMEIIAELEPFRRNLFYGSCGYLDRRGNLDLNILIRTLLSDRETVWGQVGAGIVADSIPDREWQESLAKATAQIAALDL
jgi:para-aminobenzoate synthetase component I